MTAQNGKEGLLVALETRPDLLILDINLPDMTGLQLLQRLRGHAETRDIKAIALSANSLPEDVGKGVSAGFAAYLTKPLQVDMFVDTLAQLLRS
ncbi:response regulator [Methylogaea oryzae]|uniref:response regulator n=1 Tax=Methylogaea oryzae TaxID=1295382 RepID=UPI001C3F1F38|nr:response regulator [Methylogaea oryzae]